MNPKTLQIPLLALTLSLSGCGLFQKQTQPEPVEIQTKPREVAIYQPPFPAPVRLEPVRWFVITADNLEEKLAELRDLQGGNYVVFAMTPQSYENVSYNIQELRRYIGQQTEIILYYREITQQQPD